MIEENVLNNIEIYTAQPLLQKSKGSAVRLLLVHLLKTKRRVHLEEVFEVTF
jgi:hypothetical protein